jgi:hypothetical protein
MAKKGPCGVGKAAIRKWEERERLKRIAAKKALEDSMDVVKYNVE